MGFEKKNNYVHTLLTPFKTTPALQLYITFAMLLFMESQDLSDYL